MGGVGVCILCARVSLRWDPWYQGDRAPLPWNPGTRAFFYFFIFIFLAGVNFFGQKIGKKLCFLSVFSLFLSLFLSFSVHTVWVLFSLINFTKVSCEGLKKGVPYKL